MRWRPVNASEPCQACGRTSWCARTEDGAWLNCMKSDEGPQGRALDERINAHGDTYFVHRLVEGAPAVPPVEPARKGVPCADVATRHRVYRALLEHLTLTDQHREGLITRGLTEAEIVWRGYRSAPRRPWLTAAHLAEKFGAEVCSTVPGIVQGTNKKGRRYWTLALGMGLVIPVLTAEHSIAAVRIRRDLPSPDGERYYWLSSGSEKWAYGPSPGAPIHVSLPALLDKEAREAWFMAVVADCGEQPLPPSEHTSPDEDRPRTIRLTEGELKADVANVLSATPTISIPGVGHWRKAIPVLQQLGARTVHLAFDQEAPDDPNKVGARKIVARALLTAVAGLREAGFSVAVETWRHTQGKGIDDLLVTGNRPELLEDDRVTEHVERTASAAGLPAEPRTVLARLRSEGNPVAFMTDSALTAAAMAYASLPEDWQLTRTAAKAAGVHIPMWERQIKARAPKTKPDLRAVEPGETQRHRLVAEAVTDPPASPDLVIPHGWQLSEKGVWQVQDQRVIPVTTAPLLVTGRLRDVSDGTEAWRLAWWRDGAWQQHTVDRLTASDARALVSLAGRGLPVTSLSSGDVVRYLADFEAANMAHLPRARVARQMGWQDQGRLGFLWGRTLITEGDLVEGSLEQLDPRHWGSDGVWFRGGDDGEEQFADGLHRRGTFERWLQAATLCTPYPRVMLALYASLAAPLLAILEASNFCVDWSFSTSTGKTTTLKLATSCWGLPDERETAAALTTWQQSRVFLERASAVLSGMPLIVDDTKTAKRREDVGSAIYDVCAGRGRGRGSLKGMRRTSAWRTILLSSGETQLTRFSTDGGAVARVLTLWGLPFGRDDIATEVQRIDRGLRANYGHAGPRFVQWLLRRRSDWPNFRQCHQRLQEGLLERCTSPVAGRLAGHAAVLELAAWLAHEALELPWAIPDFGPLWDEVLTEAREQDPPTEALAAVMSWCRSNAHAFWGRHEIRNPNLTKDPVIPQGGWAGAWTQDKDWKEISIAPHRLSQLIEQAGHDPESTLRTWRDRGWLNLGSDKKRLTRKMRVQSVLHWLVSINRQAIEAVQGEEIEDIEEGMLL